jgi:hypothetical protein
VSDANRRLVHREVVCLFTGVIERYLDFISHPPACAATLCVVGSHPGAGLSSAPQGSVLCRLRSSVCGDDGDSEDRHQDDDDWA